MANHKVIISNQEFLECYDRLELCRENQANRDKSMKWEKLCEILLNLPSAAIVVNLRPTDDTVRIQQCSQIEKYWQTFIKLKKLSGMTQASNER